MYTTSGFRPHGRHLIELVRRLVKTDEVSEVASMATRIVDRTEWEYAVANPDTELPAIAGARVVRVAELLAHADDVWGEADLTRQFVLGYQSLLGGVPLDLAVHSHTGYDRVAALLGRMEHGIPV